MDIVTYALLKSLAGSGTAEEALKKAKEALAAAEALDTGFTLTRNSDGSCTLTYTGDDEEETE